jgi:hypothetical protein
MDFEIGYTSREITPWGGMVVLRQMLTKLDFTKDIAAHQDLPLPGSNAGYDPATIIEAFITSVWCGANRFLHTEVTRHDSAIARIFGWKRTPAQDTYKRFFQKFTTASLHRVREHLYQWAFSKVKFDNYTLDCDSSILTRYGIEQQGAKKGYNPKKRGRLSHHPLIAFVSDVKMVANMWLRSGDASSSNNFLSFLEDTLSKLKGKRVSLMRLDSGFCSEEIMSYLETKPMDYIIAARFYEPLQRVLQATQTWLRVDGGIEVSEVSYQGAGWKAPRRLVMIRQRIEERPAAPGKALRLFADDDVVAGYRYSAYYTSLKLSAVEVWRIYRGRADAENRIKELKADFGFESFNMKSFEGTEASLTFAMLAYNLMAMFRQFVLQSKTQHTLSTLRYKTFAIGAYFEKVKGKVILRLSLNLKRREWFNGLWEEGKKQEIPWKLSTA